MDALSVTVIIFVITSTDLWAYTTKPRPCFIANEWLWAKVKPVYAGRIFSIFYSGITFYHAIRWTALKPQHLPTFLHISARVWRHRWSLHIRTEGFYVKTTIIHQLKCLCIQDCAYMESMFINFIHISLYDISFMQNILYQIKRDVAVWKRLRCPQHKQQIWWQIVATPYMGLA